MTAKETIMPTNEEMINTPTLKETIISTNENDERVIYETNELNNTHTTLEEVISNEKYSSCDDDSNLENSNRVVLEYTDADDSS